ncbi:MAG: sulfite exporter TauE/SafE family protein [Coriobacteriia bacterium]|nr:sulfite exporter TauE/SafE family protein [Coriobacteriia bacterium]
MRDLVFGLLVGLASGFLSGQFGIGGGLITTPAIRLLLGRPALIAVGTPLPVIVPTAVVGALSYTRARLSDVRGGLVVGAVGAAFAVPAALVVPLVGGGVVMVVTAVLIAYMAVDMLLMALRPVEVSALEGEGGAEGAARAATEVTEEEFAEVVPPAAHPRPRAGRLVLLGVAAGLYSGFLGLGGGFIVVPVLTRWFGYPIKRAIGTSLIAISLMALPGSVTHYALGNVDPVLALLLAVGVVPGSLLGARVTRYARERTVQVGFAVLLLVVGAMLVLAEAVSL